jgi:hypothetical protein
MTLQDVGYYSQHALNERQRAKNAQREKARRIREALERKYDAMLSPKQVRSILRIGAAKTSK